MKRILIYSHDTFGLGNIRRILNVATYLLKTIPGLSILIVTGSPMIHGFRMPKGLDYIKLPCLSRTEREGYSVKYLDTDTSEILQLRSDLIMSATLSFKPDVMLIDKKPYGVKHELKATFEVLKDSLPSTRLILLLRDILDSPETTTRVWRENGYYDAVRSIYDLVLVLGRPEIFDPRVEYEFPRSVSEKVEFCGYVQTQDLVADRAETRRQLQAADRDRVVLVTVGGGEDGYALLQAYTSALKNLPRGSSVQSLIVTGPEMSEAQRTLVQQCAASHPKVKLLEFTNDLVSYMNAADLIVAMGGYNTVCEILSLKRRAIIVPRLRPVEEQWIRAERMARMGLLTVIHPDLLNPTHLLRTVLDELKHGSHAPSTMEMNGLPILAGHVSQLLDNTDELVPSRHLCAAGSPRKSTTHSILTGYVSQLFPGAIKAATSEPLC
jgi:predicted glycosyltransferase